MRSQKELKNQWMAFEDRKLDKISNFYAFILVENQEYPSIGYK